MTTQAETNKPFSISQKLLPAVPFIAFFAIAVLLWLPFGLKANGALIEEWTGIGAQIRGEPPFFITPDMEFSWWASRPLTFFAQAAAYVIDPTSFAWLNIFGLLIQFGWGAGAFLALRRLLGGYDLLAFTVAALFMVYPADISLFTFRDIHNRTMVALYLLALYCLLVYWDERRKWALVSMWLLLLAALLHYDSGYLLVAVTPLALVWRARGITRRVIGVSLLWYIPPSISALYVLMISWVFGAQTYQLNVGTLGIHPLGALARLPRDAVRALIGGWGDAITSVITNGYGFVLYTLAGMLIFLSVGFALARRDRGRIRLGTVLALTAAGMLVIATVLFIYRLSPASQTEMRRVFYLPGLGAALIIGAVSYALLTRRAALRYAYIIFMVLLFGAAMVNALRQHAYFASLSLQQQRFLGQMIALAPRFSENTVIVVIDETGLMGDEYFFHTSSRLTDGVQFAYHDTSLKAVLCHAPQMVARTLSQTPFAPPISGRCEFSEHAFAVRFPQSTTLTSLDRVVVFRHSYDDELALVTDLSAYTNSISPAAYHPQARILPDMHPFSSGLFACFPITDCTAAPAELLPVSPFRFDFDTQVMGGGWRSLDHWGSWTTAWMIAPETSLWMRVADAADQQVRFHAAGAVNAEALEALRLTVNGSSIPLTLSRYPEGGWLYEGTIPAEALEPGVNALIFSLPRLYTAPGTQLPFGVSFNWLEITPLAHLASAEDSG